MGRGERYTPVVDSGNRGGEPALVAARRARRSRPSPPTPSSARAHVRGVPRAGERGVARVASRARDAGRGRRDRARPLRRRDADEFWRHVDLHEEGRKVLDSHRGAGRQARGLPGALHLRRRATPAVSRRVSERALPGAAGRVGFATEGGRRPALVLAAARRKDSAGRSAALDRRRGQLEPDVRRMPLDGPAQALRRKGGSLRDELVRDQRRLRSLPRPRFQPRRVGARARTRRRDNESTRNSRGPLPFPA